MSMTNALLLVGAATVIVGLVGGRFSSVLAAKKRGIITMGVVVLLCAVAIEFGRGFIQGVREAAK